MCVCVCMCVCGNVNQEQKVIVGAKFEHFSLTFVTTGNYRSRVDIPAYVNHLFTNLDSQVSLVFVQDRFDFEQPVDTADLTGQTITRDCFELSALTQSFCLELLQVKCDVC